MVDVGLIKLNHRKPSLLSRNVDRKFSRCSLRIINAAYCKMSSHKCQKYELKKCNDQKFLIFKLFTFFRCHRSVFREEKGKKSFVPFRLSFDEIVGANKCTAKKKRNWQENKKVYWHIISFLFCLHFLVQSIQVCILYLSVFLLNVDQSERVGKRATAALFLVSKVVVRGRLLTRKGRLSLVSAALYIRIRLVCIKETQKTLKILTKNQGHWGSKKSGTQEISS